MRRDYTIDMYNSMVEQINEIDREQFSDVTDFLGDGLVTIGSWIGLIDSEDYVNNIDSYHKTVLDQHDTTAEKLSEIFVDVHEVDMTYSSDIGTVNQSLITYNEILEELNSFINPDNLCFDAKTISMKAQELSYKIAKANSELETAYDAMLWKKEKQVLANAGWGILDSILSIGGGICEFTLGVLTLDATKIVSSGKDFIDGVFNIGQDAAAIVIIPMSWLLSWAMDDKDVRRRAVESAEEASERDGLAGELKASNCPEEVVAAVEVGGIIIDTVGVIDGLAGGVTEIVDGPTKPGKLEEIFEKDAKTVETAKIIYDSINDVKEGEIGKSIVGEIVKPVDVVVKAGSIVDDVKEAYEPWLETE